MCGKSLKLSQSQTALGCGNAPVARQNTNTSRNTTRHHGLPAVTLRPGLYVCMREMFCAWCVFVVDPMDVCAYVCCRSIPSLNPPWLSLVYVLSWDCRDSVAAKVRAPRQERIRAAHRQQQAVAAQAREARHGGGTSFPMVDMLAYDDSDDEGHDDDSDDDESRSSTSDDSETDARGSLRDFVIDILIHYFFSPFPRVHLAVWHGAILLGGHTWQSKHRLRSGVSDTRMKQNSLPAEVTSTPHPPQKQGTKRPNMAV